MKTVFFFSRVIVFLLLMSFVSCSSMSSTGGMQRSPSKPTQLQTTQTQTTVRTSSPYWTGDGGKGKSITILPPRSSGLAANQGYLPDLVANELVSNFNSFSAMTLFDRLNNQKQYDELLSGVYDDEDKASADLGHLASTDYMLLGDITKTSTGYTLQLTVNKNSDKTTVASYSGTVAIADLDNLTGVRKASLDLLQKMGVRVTEQTRTELTKAATTDQVNAQTAMAQGISAQRQGTEVAALSYFYQAAAFDASLVEAVSRTNVLSTNISTGNIGANIRNDFAWSDDWKAKLVETETLMNNMLRNNTPLRSLWYSDNIVEYEAARDREKRTTELRIEAVLHTYAALPVSVQKTVQAVYDGLQSTGRAQAWRFDGWPRQGITNNNPFNQRWGGVIAIAFEVLNSQDKVIGKQTVEMDSRFSFYGTQLDGPGTAFATVRFTGVSGYDIDDHLSIRIASINGQTPEKAGVSQIGPMSARQMQANKDFTVYNGAIRPSSNKRDLGAVTIPSELWGERVTAIADKAYENSGLTNVTIPSSITTIGKSAFAGNLLTRITIPEGVITIEEQAFANNGWTNTSSAGYTPHHGLTSVTIPNSVEYIGSEAFSYHWTATEVGLFGEEHPVERFLVTMVSIGANVRWLGKNAIGNNFEEFYRVNSAGTYTFKHKFGKLRPEWERSVNGKPVK